MTRLFLACTLCLCLVLPAAAQDFTLEIETDTKTLVPLDDIDNLTFANLDQGDYNTIRLELHDWSLQDYDLASITTIAFSGSSDPEGRHLILSFNGGAEERVALHSLRKMRFLVLPASIATGLEETAAAGANVTLHPNPFTQSINIVVTIDKASELQVEIVDVFGRRLSSLFKGVQRAGQHSFRWDGRNAEGQALSQGVYYCNVSIGGHQITRQLVRAGN